MTLPAFVPSSNPHTNVRFGIVDSLGFAHALPVRTTLSQPLVSDVNPQVVRMTFSKKQKRVDDGLRGPAILELQIHLEAATVSALRQISLYWHNVLKDARIFITDDGTGVYLDKKAHDINATGPIQGKSTIIVAKLVPSDSQVYTVSGSEGLLI